MAEGTSVDRVSCISALGPVCTQEDKSFGWGRVESRSQALVSGQAKDRGLCADYSLHWLLALG